MAVSRPRARTVRSLLAVAVGACFLAGGVAAVDHDPVSLGPGLVTEPVDATTLVSVQGFHFQGTANRQKPARLAAAGPRADLQWRYESRGRAKWFYDAIRSPTGTSS